MFDFEPKQYQKPTLTQIFPDEDYPRTSFLLMLLAKALFQARAEGRF